MEFQPDYSKLASAKLPPEELQAAFSTMLMNAAAIDCGSVIDPDVRHAEFGESLAVNLAIARRFSPHVGLWIDKTPIEPWVFRKMGKKR